MPLPKEGEVWQKDENAKMVVSKHNGNNLVVGEDMLLVEVRGVEIANKINELQALI